MNRDLLVKAIANIDDEFIVEACERYDKRVKTVKFKKPIRLTKKFFISVAAFACAIILCICLSIAILPSNNPIVPPQIDTETPPVNSDPPNGANVVLEDNSLKNTEVQSYYFCGYRAYSTEFNIDSVKLSFYYGSIVDVSKNLNASNLNFILEFCDVTSSYSGDTDDIYDITTYETIRIKEISFEKFCTEDCNSLKPYDGIYQYHAEEITIPNQIFKYDSGVISFSLIEEYLSSNGEVNTGMGCGIALFYKKENSKITISNKSF